VLARTRRSAYGRKRAKTLILLGAPTNSTSVQRLGVAGARHDLDRRRDGSGRSC
jgi:hypothetical protein